VFFRLPDKTEELLSMFLTYNVTILDCVTVLFELIQLLCVVVVPVKLINPVTPVKLYCISKTIVPVSVLYDNPEML